MTKSKLKILFFLSVLTACMLLIEACTASQRLNKLTGKHPELFGDTSVQRVLPGVKQDSTIPNLSKRRDTITIVKDRLTQKFYYYHDSLYVSGECAADTIYVTVPKLIDDRAKENKYPWWLYVLVFMVGVILIKDLVTLIKKIV